MLSEIFYLKFVDVTMVNSIVHSKIAQICMMFIVGPCDLNVDVFNESIGYHILLDWILNEVTISSEG